MDNFRSQANAAREKAHRFLMKETFVHVDQYRNDAFSILAQENCRLRQIHVVNHFTYDGNIYPNRTTKGFPVSKISVMAPPLHPTLLDEFDRVKALGDDDTKNQIRNLFSIILSQSNNGLVLSALLPSVLYNELKSFLSVEEFELVDQGWAADKLDKQTDVEVQGNIGMIRARYEEALTTLRRLLVDRLLLA